ncbi:hypothetical protein K439DRAFT_1623962 [Ramaria rubella]|nr:hypothetical protein K439DRAFT_1623962 [Ramaria rubella]
MTLNLQVMGPPATTGIASLQLLTVSADKDTESVDHPVVNVHTEPENSQEDIPTRKKRLCRKCSVILSEYELSEPETPPKGNEKNSKQPTKAIQLSKKTKTGPKGKNENVDFNINSKKKEAVIPVTKPHGRPVAFKKNTDRQASWALEQCLATEQLRFKYWAAKAKHKLQLSTAQFYDLRAQESSINAFTAANRLVTNKVLSAAPILRTPALPILSPRVVEEPKWDHGTWMEQCTVGYIKLQFMDEIPNDSGLKTGQESFGPLMDVGVQDLKRNGVEADADKLNDIDQAGMTTGPSGASGENMTAEG